MSTRKILFIQLELVGDRAQFVEDAEKLAVPIANVPGLIWKMWLTNEGTNTFGGLYLFESEEALSKFFDGPVAAEISKKPEFSNVEMKSFDVMEAPSLIGRTPLGEDLEWRRFDSNR